MKNEMCLALILLAVLPASAQKAANLNCPANGNAAIVSAEDYAARVDGLLRDVHASLQHISESLEAGLLTPEQARELKLSATRDMISRLDTLSAVYDGRLDLNEKACPDGATVAASSDSSARSTHHSNGTVSVEELRQERVAASVTPTEQAKGQ